MEWQDISTAPKDGTPVMLHGGVADWMHWEGCKRQVIAHWDTEGFYRGGGQWVITYFDSGAAAVCYEDATHWMPLPAPPTPTAQE